MPRWTPPSTGPLYEQLASAWRALVSQYAAPLRSSRATAAVSSRARPVDLAEREAGLTEMAVVGTEHVGRRARHGQLAGERLEQETALSHGREVTQLAGQRAAG